MISIIGILAGLTLPAIQGARETSRRMSCQSRMRQVGLALSNYDVAYRLLPAASIRPLGSTDNGRDRPRATWAIAILPMMDQSVLFQNWDSASDLFSKSNEVVRTTKLESYLCPSDGVKAAMFEPRLGIKFSRSNFAVNYGSASWGVVDWENKEYRGVMGQNVGLGIAQIMDGTSMTVCVAEVRQHTESGDNRGVWAFHAAGSGSVGLDCDKLCVGINGDPKTDWIPYCSPQPQGLNCHFQNTEDSNAGPRSQHRGIRSWSWSKRPPPIHGSLEIDGFTNKRGLRPYCFGRNSYEPMTCEA